MAHLTPRHPSSAHSSPQPRGGLLSFIRAPSPSPRMPLLPTPGPHQRRGSHGHGGVLRPIQPRICLRCGPQQAWIMGAVIGVVLLLYLWLSPATPNQPSTPAAPAEAPSAPMVRQLAQMRMRPPSHLLIHASDDPGIADEFTPADATFRLQRIPLLRASTAFPLDSTAETLMLRPLHGQGNRAYHVCTFTNVCATPEGLRLRFQNHTAWLEHDALAKRCEDHAFYWSHRICHCFHYAFKPLVLPYEFYNPVTLPISQQRAADSQANVVAAREKGKVPVIVDSFARKYPDPFLHVRAARYSHAWSIHKWVSHHHIAHWAQKLMIFQSIMQHASLLFSESLLPPLTAILFHDTSNSHPVLEDHLLNIFNLTVEAAVGWTKEATSTSTDAGEGGRTDYEWAHPLLWSGDDATAQLESLLDPLTGRLLWTEDLLEQRYTTSLPPNTCAQLDNCRVKNPAWKLAAAAKTPASKEDGSYETIYDATTGQPIPERVVDPSLHTCFARLSLSPTYGLLSQNAADVDRFRAVTGARMSLPASLNSVCPPRRAILLTRADRRILNAAELDSYMLSRHGLTLEHHRITERNSSLEQVALFAETGLILSSHSSQLINVLFSHPSQALVEISAEFYNTDFAAYAHAVGLWFSYALGGSIPRDAKEDPRQDGGYTFVEDPLMRDCVRALQSSCPTGASSCLMRVSHLPSHCGRVSQWPNKQMNFFANLTAIDVAVTLAVQHIHDKCGGKW